MRDLLMRDLLMRDLLMRDLLQLCRLERSLPALCAFIAVKNSARYLAPSASIPITTRGSPQGSLSE